MPVQQTRLKKQGVCYFGQANCQDIARSLFVVAKYVVRVACLVAQQH